MILAIVDVETTGTDPKKDRIVEYACARYDTSLRCLIDCHSVLLNDDVEGRWGAQDIHGIDQLACVAYGLSHKHGERIDVPRCDVVAAYCADFDRSFLDAHVERRLWADRPWLDLMDLDWPRKSNGRSLVNLALAHGVGVTRAHRAISDVLLCVDLLARVQDLHDHDDHLDHLIAKAMLPRVRVKANVSFSDNHLAKEKGFTWNSEARMWTKKVLPEERVALPFETMIVEEVPT